MCNNKFGNYAPCDCSDIEKAALQREVENNCKGGIMKKCTEADNCPTLVSKENQFVKCMNVRIKINTKCFKGGDAGHQAQVQQTINGMINCQAIATRKCKPEVEKQPKPDEGFMKKMEEITGLTGAALIIYLIISEGSRLFPPRNAIPIP